MRFFGSLFVFGGMVLAGFSLASAEDFSSTNFTVQNPEIISGGYATSTSFTLQSVIGGVAIGTSTSSTFGDNAGFLFYPFVTTPVVSATAGDGQVALSWTAASAGVGWTVGSYSVGQSTTSGGPYTFTSVGSAVSATRTGLTNGTAYYFVIRVADALGGAIATSTQVSATPASSGDGGGGGGGSGSGSGVDTAGGGGQGSGATVALSGRAYPAREVTILRDGMIVSSVLADATGSFSTTETGLSGGNYIFSVYSEDASGNRSSLLTLPISMAAGGTTNIGGIFIPPTIDTDKIMVKQGDTIAIFGQSVPYSTVTILVNSATQSFASAQSDARGAYRYNLDSGNLEMGDHTAQSKSAISGEISGFGAAVAFAVGTENILRQPKPTSCQKYDLNCDKLVNLVDVSILVYWYERELTGSGRDVDLNGDNKIDLIDFSILASHWTG